VAVTVPMLLKAKDTLAMMMKARQAQSPQLLPLL
jgi:hypothetical protein